MDHPDLNYLIQREILNDRIREGCHQRLMPPSSAVHPVRRFAGQLLVRMGTRLAPTPRPVASRPAIGGIALAGRIDR